MDWWRVRFLSMRGVCIGVGLVLSSLAGATGIVVGAVTGRTAWWALAVCLLLLVACAFTCWFWIILPYRRFEQSIRAFLEDYSINGMQENEVPFSPGTERLFEQARAVMNPSQLFKLNKRQAQYLALQNQINPHFLYNTLESIRSEALIAQMTGVADMTVTPLAKWKIWCLWRRNYKTAKPISAFNDTVLASG